LQKKFREGLSYIPGAISTILKLPNTCHSIQYKKMMTLLRMVVEYCAYKDRLVIESQKLWQCCKSTMQG